MRTGLIEDSSLQTWSCDCSHAIENGSSYCAILEHIRATDTAMHDQTHEENLANLANDKTTFVCAMIGSLGAILILGFSLQRMRILEPVLYPRSDSELRTAGRSAASLVPRADGIPRRHTLTSTENVTLPMARRSTRLDH